MALGWVVALALAAFVLGFAVRGFVLPSPRPEVGMPGASTFESPPGGAGNAPPLSEEQLQQGMPQGHPPLGETPTQPATTAPAVPSR